MPTFYDRYDGSWHPCLSLKNGRVGVGTLSPLFRLHASAPGAFGGEDVNGVALPGNVPIVAQSDSTAIGVLNTQGRPAFALNIDANLGANGARGVPTFYDRYDGSWHRCLSLKNGRVGIGALSADPQFSCEVRSDTSNRAALAAFGTGDFATLSGTNSLGNDFGVAGESRGEGAASLD